MEIPVPNEAVVTIYSILFERWITVFGSPMRFLYDRRKPFVSRIVQNFFSRVGTRKIFTTSYSTQTDGCVERINATLCRDLAKFVTYEVDWDNNVAFAVFRYN